MLWQFRSSLRDNPKALCKVLQSVDISVNSHVAEIPRYVIESKTRLLLTAPTCFPFADSSPPGPLCRQMPP